MTSKLINLSQKLKKFKVLSFADQIRIIKLVCLLLVTKLLIRVLPFSVFIKIYTKALRKGKLKTNRDYDNTSLLLNYATSAIPGDFSCLIKALVYKYYYRNSTKLRLIIGVRRDHSKELSFHAWVEKHDKILMNYKDGESFKRLWEIK